MLPFFPFLYVYMCGSTLEEKKRVGNAFLLPCRAITGHSYLCVCVCVCACVRVCVCDALIKVSNFFSFCYIDLSLGDNRDKNVFRNQ